MTRRLGLFLAAAISAVSLAGVGQAASLGLNTKAEPHFNAIGTVFSFGGGFSFLDFSMSGAGTGALAGYSLLDVSMNADILPDGSIGGGFNGLSVGGAAYGALLSSATLTGFGSVFDANGLDRLEFNFDLLGEAEAGHFSDGALVTLTGEFGSDVGQALALAANGMPGVLITVAPIAPVPLPATGLLLLGGLGAMAMRRRKLV